MLIQVLYSIRSERQLMEQVQYNLLFRWFIGLAMDEEVWVVRGAVSRASSDRRSIMDLV